MRTRTLAPLPLLFVALAACGTSVVNGTPTGTSSASGDGGAGVTSTGTVTMTTGVGGSGGFSTTTTTTTTTTVSSSSSTGTGGAGGGADARPPGHPPAPFDTYGTGSVTFAISKLYLGNTDRDGTPDPVNGWKQYGFDIDGKISTATSTDLCQPLDNASPHNVYPDGLAGIDNSFGKNILPILLGLASDVAQKANDAITSGKTTLLFDLAQLGTGSNYDPLGGQLYPVTDLGHAPLFDGTDVWPVDPAGLAVAGDLTTAKVQFPGIGSYLNGNTWVGQATSGVPFTLSTGSIGLPLVIHGAIVTMTLDPTHSHATNGTISGVLYTSEMIAAIKQAAGSFDPTLCSGPTIDSITAQIAQASDILQNGSQYPTDACDAISIGLGFDAERVQLGPIGPATTPPPNPCP